MPYKSIFFVFWLFFCFQINAQTIGSTKFTIDNGLPSNTIYDFVNDEHGFLWIATDYGISKFDGATFKNYTIKDGLIGNEILSLTKDSKNRIWLAAFNGKVGFIKNGKFYNDLNSHYLKTLNFNNFVKDIYEDSNGNIIFSQKKLIKILDKENNITEIIIPNNVKTYGALVLEDKNNNLIFLTSINGNKQHTLITKNLLDKNQDWAEFNPSNFNYESIKQIKNNYGLEIKKYNDTIMEISKNYTSKSDYLSKVYNYKNKIIITNLYNGVHLFDKNNFNSKPKVYLPNTRTTRAYIDNDKNIWIGTHSNGLYYFPNLYVTGINFSNTKKNNFYSINYFNNSIIAGNEKNEILVLNPETLKIENSFKVNTSPERVRKLKVHNKKLFVLSETNIHSLDSANNFSKIDLAIKRDLLNLNIVNFKDINLLNNKIITSNSNGVSSIDLNTKKIEKIWETRSTAVFQKSKDSIFIGTTKGLYLKTKNGIKKYDLGYLFNNSIIYSLENSTFGLLIGSNSFGLGILKGNKFSSISTNNGLLSNYIKSIYVCEDENIWLSTNLGLNNLTLDSNNKIKTLKSYTISEGLFSNDVRDCIVANSKVYIATSNGVNVIDLKKENLLELKPKIHLNKILVNNRPLNKNDSNNFNSTSNNFEFDYSGISFKSLGNIHFKYRLKGFDKEWVETENNTVRYANLPAGNFTFEAISVAKNNVLSENSISYNFKITPSFYNTWWFATLILVFSFLTLYIYFIIRNQRLNKEAVLNESISNLKYKALNSQMSPHFISNLLTNINSLMNNGKYELAEDSLQQFGNLVKSVLNSTKSNLIGLNEELNMVNSYLKLQQIRFKSLNYTINTSSLSKDDLEFILVPPMIIQPIVENSIKHGFSKKDENNNITINFSIESEDYLICEIVDNGKGIKTKSNKHKGISIENIQERLELISFSEKKEQLILVENIYNEFSTLVGLKVTIKIPM